MAMSDECLAAPATEPLTQRSPATSRLAKVVRIVSSHRIEIPPCGSQGRPLEHMSPGSCHKRRISVMGVTEKGKDVDKSSG